MIWVVSKEIYDSDHDLIPRHKYIEEVTQTRVSPWVECRSPVNYFRCSSLKGEYGIVITAHIGEVQPILEVALNNKRALVIINSCILKKYNINLITKIVRRKNPQSIIYWAKQDIINGYGSLVFNDDCGTFGFKTTASERELFMHRSKGLLNAINQAYERIDAK